MLLKTLSTWHTSFSNLLFPQLWGSLCLGVEKSHPGEETTALAEFITNPWWADHGWARLSQMPASTLCWLFSDSRPAFPRPLCKPFSPAVPDHLIYVRKLTLLIPLEVKASSVNIPLIISFPAWFRCPMSGSLVFSLLLPANTQCCYLINVCSPVPWALHYSPPWIPRGLVYCCSITPISVTNKITSSWYTQRLFAEGMMKTEAYLVLLCLVLLHIADTVCFTNGRLLATLCRASLWAPFSKSIRSLYVSVTFW